MDLFPLSPPPADFCLRHTQSTPQTKTLVRLRSTKKSLIFK